MPTTTPLAGVEPHYRSPIERSADRWVHILGLSGASVGSLAMLGLSLGVGRLGQAAAVAIYALCLLLMFLASIAYNMAGPSRRPLLRRLDHAAIFLMIAGSYTPFTTQRLTGAWSIGMTAAVWAIAVAAAAGKLFAPGLGRKVWIALYLALGWIAVVAIRPLLAAVPARALLLLLAGGLVYSLGVIVYLKKDLPFRRAIWHGFVTVAAGTHYAAILTGVVLVGAA